MRQRRGSTRRDRNRLRELADAVEKELAGGRPRAAVVRDLLSLGFDKPTAQRFVGTVVRAAGARRAAPQYGRLATAALLMIAGIAVGGACLASRQFGFAFAVAVLASLAGTAD